MARLPQVGGDNGSWGAILNDFLSQSHAADGTLAVDSVGAPQLKPSSVTNAAIAPATIAEDKLASDVQTKLNTISAATQTALDTKTTGPASSVANSLPRFNGTSGKVLQGSGITVDNTDHLSISTTNSLGKLTVKGENTNTEFVGLFMESGITPVNSAASNTMGRMVSVQGNNGAYFMGRDVTNNVEFIMGTSSGGSAFVGSMTSHNLDLRTGNVSKVFIQHSTGNIGVGTTSPGEKLAVNGNISSTGTVNGRNVSADGVKVDIYGMGTVVHGATAATARPTGFGCITWIGSVQPTNALTNDIWIYKA